MTPKVILGIISKINLLQFSGCVTGLVTNIISIIKPRDKLYINVERTQ